MSIVHMGNEYLVGLFFFGLLLRMLHELIGEGFGGYIYEAVGLLFLCEKVLASMGNMA